MKLHSPFSLVVRSMRRCDRMFIPLLKTWIPVDVVMTKHEIVYFSTTVYVDEDGDEVRNQADSAGYVFLERLKQTKGGKGLRLSDVATGRKVVGNLKMSDIRTVKVERVEPSSSALSNNRDTYNGYGYGSNCMDDQVEYWHTPDESEYYSGIQSESRDIRWTRVNEYKLTIEKKGGTFVLRFYSDLEELERKFNLAGNGEATATPVSLKFKEINAFQWAATIARFCGPQQLKQKLPHFGENNEDELRDYLH